MQTDFLFLAWLAGFVDGEGCITLNYANRTDGSRTYRPDLRITQSDRRVLDMIAERLGCGGVYACADDGSVLGRRPRWQYAVTGRAALRVVAAILPYLILKREEAEVLSAFRPIPVGGRGPRHEPARAEQQTLYLRLRALKRGGTGTPAAVKESD